MPELGRQLILQFILIVLNAFFAAAEIAVISLNGTKVKARAEDGDKKAAKMLRMIDEPTGFLSTIQIGITLAGFLASAFAADNFAARLTAWLLDVFRLPHTSACTINTVSVVLITILLSFCMLVLGELVPKRVAMRYSEKLASAVCGIITFLTKLLKPAVWLLTKTTNGILRLLGIDPNENDKPVSEEDIVVMIDAGAEEGTLNADNIEYIKNVFELDHMTAADVMTPRGSMEMVAADASEEEILETIRTSGYSRLPVFEETADNIVGILHIRDYLLRYKEPGFTLASVTSQPAFVPETIHLDSLFKDMQTDHNHIAIVVDEYGGTAGLLTMEDILEEIVGEIWDEQDEEIKNIVKTGDDRYKVLAVTPIDEFFEFFELDEDETIESATVNGWVTEHSETIPEEGFSFDYQNLTITVTKAEELRTQELSVIVHSEEKTEEE